MDIRMRNANWYPGNVPKWRELRKRWLKLDLVKLGESVAGSGFPARERHVCPDPSCGSSFSFRSGLSRHVKDKHPSENNCRCHVCNKRY